MKHTLFLLTFAVMALSAAAQQTTEIPYTFAHRGGHIDGIVPENCPAGVKMAAKYGYRAVECDVHYTKDSVLVCMHDPKINRVMRLAEGYGEIPEPVKYREVNFGELRSKYVLASSDPALRTPIATFDEILAACKECGMTALLHTDEPEAYKRACEVLGPKGFIAFDVSYEALTHARDYSSECLILWDPNRTPAEEVIEKLKALGGPCGISSMKKDLLTADYTRPIREAGFSVQASIFTMPGDIEAAENGCNIILSDFCLFAPENSPARKQSRSEERDDITIAAGESIHFEWDAVQFGSIEMLLDFTGEVEVQVNDDITYTLSGNGRHLIDGWRFYEKTPSFTVTAKKESSISKLKVSLLKY